MSHRLTWKRGYVYCVATTKKGHPCGNKTVKGTRYCHVHRKGGLELVADDIGSHEAAHAACEVVGFRQQHYCGSCR